MLKRFLLFTVLALTPTAFSGTKIINRCPFPVSYTLAQEWGGGVDSLNSSSFTVVKINGWSEIKAGQGIELPNTTSTKWISIRGANNFLTSPHGKTANYFCFSFGAQNMEVKDPNGSQAHARMLEKCNGFPRTAAFAPLFANGQILDTYEVDCKGYQTKRQRWTNKESAFEKGITEGLWLEHNHDGKLLYNFQEIQRTETSVYLRDASRSLWILLQGDAAFIRVGDSGDFVFWKHGFYN